MPVPPIVRRVAAAATVAVLIAAGSACASDPPSAVVGLTVAGCPPGTAHGSGVVIEPGLVLTSAHVVKGATEIEVTNGDRSTTAEVVGFDPDMDLAYLAVEPGLARPASIGDDPIEGGELGRAYVFRDGAVEVVPVRVRRPVQIHTEDIYIEGDTYRPGFELDAEIRSGDSGGPVMVDGEVIGVIWARSSKFDARAYAIDPVAGGDTIRRQVRTGVIDESIDLERCN